MQKELSIIKEVLFHFLIGGTSVNANLEIIKDHHDVCSLWYFPYVEVIDLLKQAGSDVFSTAEAGTIVVTIDGKCERGSC